MMGDGGGGDDVFTLDDSYSTVWRGAGGGELEVEGRQNNAAHVVETCTLQHLANPEQASFCTPFAGDEN